MSYCRFSSDDFQSDVYCYEHVDGLIAVHVARNRIVYQEPLPELVPIEDFNAWWERDKSVREMRERAEWVPIKHELAGQNFECETHREAADLLTRLQGEGFRVPQRAIDRLREDGHSF